ncbi:hypothetical protein U1Q18_006324 [Sarracenia purpurea var. burkii]
MIPAISYFFPIPFVVKFRLKEALHNKLESDQVPALEDKTGFHKKNMEDNQFADNFPEPLSKLNLKETSEFVRSFPMAKPISGSKDCLDVSAQRRREGDGEGEGSVTRRNNVEAPSTPGRPVFSFSNGNLSRKSFPSKWDDAEKWLSSSSSCHDSPAHRHPHHHVFNLRASESSRFSKQSDGFRQQTDVFAEKSRVTEEKVSAMDFDGVSAPADVLLKGRKPFFSSTSIPLPLLRTFPFLCATIFFFFFFQTLLFTSRHHFKQIQMIINGVSVFYFTADKFTNEVEPTIFKYKCSEQMTEGFLFENSERKSRKTPAKETVHEVKHRDIGTEMTPLGSSTNSWCHTPFKSLSPARHNTPANRSGPLALVNCNGTKTGAIDITQLQECHLAKLSFGTQFDSMVSTWSSREEEEEDVSKSLRHSEIGNGCRKSVSGSRACTWEEDDKNKRCLRYQREEAKIQAWVNLQSAKAEAQSRKLEVPFSISPFFIYF